jgi:hypothetical protein
MAVGAREASVLRPHGTLITFDCDGPEQEHDTVQCCHCGRHWIFVAGSGKKRGFCVQCNGITCGNPVCDRCVPIEQQIENMEKHRDPFYRPIVSTVGIDLK